MIHAVKIYTKTGDGGETSLLSGGRVAKDHPRIEAYGTLDELNAVLGTLLAEPVPKRAADVLHQIQRDLFAIGAALADAKGRYSAGEDQWPADPIEAWIDEMEDELEPLKNFILPGGCREACLAHVARTVCRRAERCVVAIDQQSGGLPPGVIEYLNRLSDSLFVLARWLNRMRDIEDVPWHPSPSSSSESE
jgi:cob(I)alamin adenosyltransferase